MREAMNEDMNEAMDEKIGSNSKNLNSPKSHNNLRSGANADSKIAKAGNAATHSVYLGLGSNLGEREKNLTEAIGMLKALPNTEVAAVSAFHTTTPWGYVDQPDFLNCAVLINTTLSPHAILEACMDIERRLGRVRAVRWGPRVIDIDILFYDDMIIKDEGLQIPHPLLHEREFVLLPLTDIAPGLVHPVFGMTVSSLYERLCAK